MMESTAPEAETPTSPGPAAATITLGVQKDDKDQSARFRGDGTSFRAKLIGIESVNNSRGDTMCQASLIGLKAIAKASGQHKLKIVINVSLNGVKLINLTTAQVIHEHRVDRISYIARDMTDRRAFGYIFGPGEGKHQFFALKTAKAAESVVLALRDLFQVVYEMKKKEIEEKKKQARAEEVSSEDVYAVPNNRPLVTAESRESAQRNISALEEQLENIHQVSELNTFNTSLPEDTPMSPDTPGSPNVIDMFGMTTVSSGLNSTKRNDFYGGELAAAWNTEGLQPAPTGGAEFTKDQILAGFGQRGGAPASGMLHQQQQGASGLYGAQSGAFGGHLVSSPPQQPMYRAPPPVPPNPFGGMFGSQPQGQAAPMGMFSPPGPRPAIPPRPSAMAPAVSTVPQTGVASNLFGDTFGAANSGSVLSPVNSQANLPSNPTKNEDTKPADPFASLLPDIGSGASTTTGTDMFKNFEMAKPPQPPPRSNANVSANFDDYFLKSVGGIPIDVSPHAAVATTNGGLGEDAGSDPFSMFGSSNMDQPVQSNPQQQTNDDFASLFG